MDLALLVLLGEVSVVDFYKNLHFIMNCHDPLMFITIDIKIQIFWNFQRKNPVHIMPSERP